MCLSSGQMVSVITFYLDDATLNPTVQEILEYIKKVGSF